MRTILLLACIVAGMAGSSLCAAPHRLESLAWLLGHWDRVGLAQGRSGYERWRVDGDGYASIGATLEGTRVLFEETLRIEVAGDDVFYVADVAGNARPVRFRCVEQSDGKVVFENPAHDFPKRIAYAVDGDRLEARISGDGHERVFRFERASGSDAEGRRVATPSSE